MDSPIVLKPQQYKLTTAEILYHMPDYPKLLQTYVWQELDIAPQFPVLKNFLDFWSENLEGKLHSVTVAHCELIHPKEFHFAEAEFKLQ